jgi:hypothetical protein
VETVLHPLQFLRVIIKGAIAVFDTLAIGIELGEPAEGDVPVPLVNVMELKVPAFVVKKR